MIWLTWRQHRSTLLAFTALFGVLMVIYLVADRTTRNYTLENVADFLWLLPAVIGVFAGAPLVAGELAHGTHRYVWTQEITRRRWLWTKLGMLTAATLVLGGMFSLVYRGWYTDSASRIFLPGLYGPWDPLRGFELAPLAFPAYCLFGFALAVAAGTLLRRTIPAMAIALFGVPTIILLVRNYLRPNYLPPLVQLDPYMTRGAELPAGSWVTEYGYADRAGNVLDNASIERLTGIHPWSRTSEAEVEASRAAYDAAGIQFREEYQPGDRFWTFQAIEAGMFVLLAAACIALTVWLVRRRLV